MFSLCVCGFSLGTLASSHSPKICRLIGVGLSVYVTGCFISQPSDRLVTSLGYTHLALEIEVKW